MREILKELNSSTGTNGSMVITPDGIMVAAAFNADLEEDTVAAFASSLLVSLKRSLSKIRAPGRIGCCTLRASNGSVMFVDMQNAYLVVVAASDQELDPDTSAVQDAIHKIKNRRVA
jgi:predicted regulator of Ras-like GTPase activity (Roadblock/LC7/MglB family)